MSDEFSQPIFDESVSSLQYYEILSNNSEDSKNTRDIIVNVYYGKITTELELHIGSSQVYVTRLRPQSFIGKYSLTMLKTDDIYATTDMLLSMTSFNPSQTLLETNIFLV